MATLPGGFSPINAIKQVGDAVNPLNGKTDYDVFGQYSVNGGVRSPSNGAFIGPQTQPAVQGAVSAPPAPAAPAAPGSGTYSEADAQAAADKAQLEQALFGINNGINSATDGLGRLGGQRQTGADNIMREFQAAADQLLGKRTLSDQQFGQNTTTQLNEYQQARNRSADGARSYLEGARRTLGAQGAGGGSAAQFALPFEAQTMAAKGNGEAQSTNNKNIISLTQGHDKDRQDIENEEKRVASQRDQGVRDLDSRIESKRAELLNTIASLTGQRSILNGGNAKSAMAAANPFISQIPGILNNIDSLSATVPIAAQDISLSRPDLSGYNFAQPQAAPVAQQDPTLAANPVLAMLGLDDPNQQKPLVPVPLYDDSQQLQYA
jgi:hypothetical protein